jgi:hypothetical protein
MHATTDEHRYYEKRNRFFATEITEDSEDCQNNSDEDGSEIIPAGSVVPMVSRTV